MPPHHHPFPATTPTSARTLQQRIFNLLQKTPELSLKTLTQTHTQIITNNLSSSKNFLLAPLISLYASLNLLRHAHHVFSSIEKPSTTAWNQIIRAHGRSELPRRAMEMYAIMGNEGVEADGYTYLYAISACSRSGLGLGSGLIVEGGQIHGRVLGSGHGRNLFVGTSLVKFYGEKGGLGDARQVFDEMCERNVATWNTLIRGCFVNGDVEGVGRVFEEMPERNVVSWTMMVSGCVKHGWCVRALELFRKMRRCGFGLDQVALVSALSACGELGDLELGRWIHSYVKRSLDGRKHEISITLHNALIHMYASCGVLEEADELFKDIPRRNTVSWTSMISGYAKHGYGEEALRVFEWMQNSDVVPDAVTFIGVLSACGRAGYVEKGKHCFKEMKEKWSIEPGIEHFGCMVDLLSRAGRLDEAYSLVENMPMKPNDAIWGALIGGCRIHRNTDLAFHSVQYLTLHQNAEKAMGYLALLSNAYAMAKRWDDVIRVRQEMMEMDTGKPSGKSWVQINGAIQDFFAGDQSH